MWHCTSSFWFCFLPYWPELHCFITISFWSSRIDSLNCFILFTKIHFKPYIYTFYPLQISLAFNILIFKVENQYICIILIYFAIKYNEPNIRRYWVLCLKSVRKTFWNMSRFIRIVNSTGLFFIMYLLEKNQKFELDISPHVTIFQFIKKNVWLCSSLLGRLCRITFMCSINVNTYIRLLDLNTIDLCCFTTLSSSYIRPV